MLVLHFISSTSKLVSAHRLTSVSSPLSKWKVRAGSAERFLFADIPRLNRDLLVLDAVTTSCRAPSFVLCEYQWFKSQSSRLTAAPPRRTPRPRTRPRAARSAARGSASPLGPP